MFRAHKSRMRTHPQNTHRHTQRDGWADATHVSEALFIRSYPNSICAGATLGNPKQH